ncbi:MAG TPA: FAD-dependent oxidoreductase [Polyangia bacterium]|nr:FAD-dependent oxidoreductase [Polyangia bacterium]
MTACPYLTSLEDLQAQELDCLIIGSGPAGTAVAEHLYTEGRNLRIGVLERGPVLTTSHISNVLRPQHEVAGLAEPTLLRDQARGAFIARHQEKPWAGDFENDGIMINAFGGRGIVAGAHLPRFYEDDLDGHGQEEHARWPINRKQLEAHYQKAELRRNVSFGECKGRMQTWALCQLQRRNAREPPWGVDVRSGTNADISLGYDSAASRLWHLLVQDDWRAKGDINKRRLLLATNAYAYRLILNDARDAVRAVSCFDTRVNPSNQRQATIKLDQFKTVVLAASTVESARLALLSGLGEGPTGSSAERVLGHYLAEHIFVRSAFHLPSITKNPNDQFINVVIPPTGPDPVHRFHIHLVGGPSPSPEHPNSVLVRLTAEAAMDPTQSNHVRLSGARGPAGEDAWGIPKAEVVCALSERDQSRTGQMIVEMRAVAAALGGTLPEKLEPMPPGRSHHEAGTLRMGTDPKHSVVDPTGRFHNMKNLYCSDASVFPYVGVANPMLTITAVGYHVATNIDTALLSARTRADAESGKPASMSASATESA